MTIKTKKRPSFVQKKIMAPTTRNRDMRRPMINFFPRPRIPMNGPEANKPSNSKSNPALGKGKGG